MCHLRLVREGLAKRLLCWVRKGSAKCLLCLAWEWSA